MGNFHSDLLKLLKLIFKPSLFLSMSLIWVLLPFRCRNYFNRSTRRERPLPFHPSHHTHAMITTKNIPPPSPLSPRRCEPLYPNSQSPYVHVQVHSLWQGDTQKLKKKGGKEKEKKNTCPSLLHKLRFP